MNREVHWEVLINRFKKKLGGWKVKLLSVGGRLSLIKSVLGSLGVYYMSLFKAPECVLKKMESMRAQFFWGGDETEKKMSWIAWNKVLNTKEKGGLGIGSLRAFNIALLYKWRWRFHTDTNGVRRNIIKSIHGVHAGLNPNLIQQNGRGTWKDISKIVVNMHMKQLIPHSLMKRNIGNDENTFFSLDPWVGSHPLMVAYPRLYALEVNKFCSIAYRRVGDNWIWNWSSNIRPESRTSSQLQKMESLIHQIHLVDSEDKWSWDLEPDGIFSVAGTRRALDDHFLDVGDRPTRWSRLVPIKVNILTWRACVDRLPTRVNLVTKGIDLHSSLCPMCNNQAEVASHVFIHCDVARHVWENTFRWIDMDPPMYSSVNELLEWVDSCNARVKRKQLLEAIVQTSIWVLWKFRNNMIFSSTKMKKSSLFDLVVLHSFEWVTTRNKNFCINWTSWLQNPMIHIL